VLGVVQAPLITLSDTIGQQGTGLTAPEGASFPILGAQDGWFLVYYHDNKLWTSQRGVRMTTASAFRLEQKAKEADSRQVLKLGLGIAGGLGLLIILLVVVIQRRRVQEVRRRWILLATRHEVLEEVLIKAGWDVQKLPENTRMGEFLPHVRPTVVIADQAQHSADVASLEARNASVASTPVLWLDATLFERSQDPSRAYLPPGSKVSAILEAVGRLATSVPGREQLSRRAEIEGELGEGRLLELLHFLATAQRTGRVEVRRLGDSAWMWFEDGQLRHAEADPLVGIPAVYHCLDLTKGSFAFRAGLPPPTKSIRENSLTLLHEYARQHDEHGKIPRP